MKLTKILMAAMLVMLVFAVAPAAAGDGTEEDPYLVHYVGYNYFGMYNDMIGGDVPLSIVTSNVTTNLDNTVYYTTYYTAIDYNANYFPDAGSLNDAADEVDITSSAGFDYLITDMAFTDYEYDTIRDDETGEIISIGPVDTARAAFYNACDASSIPDKASIYSNNGNTSFAPASFDYRDLFSASLLNYDPIFTPRIDDGLAAIPGGFGYNVTHYEIVLSYLN
ncbi:hypothetical protein LJC08_04230 [Methanimicrococcus sp. OttesenSCG-928-J09]|nr:hypothetical protein [Methanimicrococcus sp. OttesenSCG-928-J09]